MIRLLAAAALAVLAVPANAAAGDAAKTETAVPSLKWMVGEWRGAGLLFGRASAVTLTVKPILGGAACSFDYTVAVPAEGNKPAIQFAAHAFYQMAKGKKWQGRWLDSFGNLHDISGEVADGKLASVWGSPSTEIGRSTYTREGATLRVSDLALRKTGQFEEFASATLTKN